MWSPRSQERHGRELASVQTPPRHVYYNPDFPSLSSEPMWDAAFDNGLYDARLSEFQLPVDGPTATSKLFADQSDAMFPRNIDDGVLVIIR